MIRTEVVTLTVIPAVAYRQKLPSGGSGVTILREDAAQPGLASISKTSGEAIPAANTPADLYPAQAFDEAIRLTAGMPYRKRGAVRLVKKAVEEYETEVPAEAMEEEAAVDSAEYRKIVETYTDKNGKLSYELLNRDLIRFAHFSSRVRAMQRAGAGVEEIRAYILTAKFRSITGNRRLTDAQAAKITQLLDEVSPKGVLRALNDELRRKAARK